MCWKLVDDNSGEIINRSTIRSAIESGSANLQVDPLEHIPKPIDDTTGVLDDFMSLADFDTPFSHVTSPSPIDSIPASTKSQVWQETIRDVEHYEDTQQRHFILLSPRLLNNSIDTLPNQSQLEMLIPSKL